MEKPAARARAAGVGLLGRTLNAAAFGVRRAAWCACVAIALLNSAPLGAAVSQAQMQSLTLEPEPVYFFAGQECPFTLRIYGADPGEIDFAPGQGADGVQFASSTKVAFAQETGEQGGTLVQVRVLFERPGVYELAPARVVAGGRSYSIPFARVTVYPDPATLRPQLYATLDATGGPVQDLACRDHATFTVYVRYARHISSLSWGIPEDSVFAEVRRYDSAQGKTLGTAFSPQAEPVATFDWQPLVAGTYRMPRVTVRATAYDGSVADAVLPEQDVVVRDAPQQPQQGQDGPALAMAFARPPQDAGQPMVQEMPADVYQTLLSLRRAERRSLPLGASWRERRAVEQQAGITAAGMEPSVPLVWALLGVAAVCAVAAVALFLRHKGTAAAVVLGVAVAWLSAGAVAGVFASRTYALSRGCVLSQIPEPDAPGGMEIPRGERLRVQHEAGGWVYVRYADVRGWVPQDSIDRIR